MTRAKAITLEVHRRAWQSLTPGVLASEVTRFIDQQHRALNGGTGSSFRSDDPRQGDHPGGPSPRLAKPDAGGAGLGGDAFHRPAAPGPERRDRLQLPI